MDITFHVEKIFKKDEKNRFRYYPSSLKDEICERLISRAEGS